MAKKRHQNPRLAKIHRSYKVDEVADLYQVDKNTVRNWIKKGLPTCDKKRPIMIHGSDLNAFHTANKVKNKRACQLHEIYCLRCRSPQTPAENMVEYQPINAKTGNLIAICPVCTTMMYRRVANSKIRLFQAEMHFTLPLAHLHIVDSH